MSGKMEPVKTPISRLVMLWRKRFLPLLVWGAAVALVIVLVQRQRVYVDAVGIAEAKTTYVAPLFDGTVQSLAVDMLDTVAEGQVVAMMDDTLIRSELHVAEAELDRVRALLDAESARFAQEQQMNETSAQDDVRRFQLNEEQARLNHLDRVIQHETDKVDLERLGVQLRRQEEMMKQHLLDEAAYDESRLAYEALKTKIDKDVKAIALAEQNIAAAASRSETRTGEEPVPAPTDAVLRSLQADIAAQQAIVAEVQERRQALTLKSPVAGQVALITRRPGESMLAGDPILTIVGAGANRVTAFVDERAAMALNVGDTVELHSRTHPSTVARGKILKIGSYIEPFPERLQMSPVLIQHGFQVLVGELPENVYRPGETLDLRLRAVM
jgi:multidrug resistance efflux pump